MSVTGGGVNVGVSQELLHDPHISAGGQSERGKGMAAAMGREITHFRVIFPECLEELAVIPGEVPGMPKCAGLCAKDELAAMGECMYQVSDFRHEGQGAQALGGLDLEIFDQGCAALLVDTTANGEGVVGEIIPLEA